MDRGDKPPPSHVSLTWACDRKTHTTGCVLTGSKVVGTWETGPILGVPRCMEITTLLQCVCPHHGGDSASVGSLCRINFPYFCSHKVVTISLCPFLTSSFSPSSFSPLPLSFPPSLLASLLFSSLLLSPARLSLSPSQSRPLSSSWIHSLQGHALFLLPVHLPK